MRKQIVGLAVVAMLVGCTSEWDPGRRSASLPKSGMDAMQVRAKAGGDAGQRRVASFASLPDRGELLAYDRSRGTSQRGAYTSHPIRLSEEHAFRESHEGGELVVTAPNGEPLRFRYDHHVEHPDGNWTWVGRDADGADAVLTFGEEAVFGVIPDGKHGTLRVTTRGGGAWLVATDASREPDINRAATRSGRPDFLVPPSLGAAIASAQQQSPATAAQDVVAAAGVSTIDVVLGYTNGYAAQLGGASVAVTRLTNLVAIANQAMANSQIVRRLRLVNTVQVTYTDATTNALTLEELTGYRSGTGSIPVPAALQPLRNARDQYGGDLVALVRAFRTPENDGCGIAWLIGSGQTTVTSADAPFGYSVVSDGQDEDEDGLTYTCREESLAHEMGHNMGQAHNEDDAEDSGVHAYSYGYRETSATGFYTVMAYRLADSSQVSIRYFANPSISFQGRPTGVANSADNARSMNQTMPIVAAFRAQVIPAQPLRNDVNGNGSSDLFWRNTAGRLSYWLMNGAAVAYASPSVAQATSWTLVASGDFDGIGRAELVWQNASSIVMWRNTGTGNDAGFIAQTIAARPSGWSIVGSTDIDGDSKQDLLWRNTTTGNFTYWLMNGTAIRLMAPSVAVSPSYRLVAIGDFNGDGRGELVWDNDVSIWMWRATGSGFAQARVGNHPAGWSIIGAGDVSGDGKSDLFWRQTATGRFSYWVMNGSSVTATPPSIAVTTSYRLAAYGDLNGDTRTDLVWDNGSSVWAWLSQGSVNNFTQTRISAHPAGWSMLNPPGT